MLHEDGRDGGPADPLVGARLLAGREHPEDLAGRQEGLQRGRERVVGLGPGHIQERVAIFGETELRGGLPRNEQLGGAHDRVGDHEGDVDLHVAELQGPAGADLPQCRARLPEDALPLLQGLGQRLLQGGRNERRVVPRRGAEHLERDGVGG